MDLTLQVNEIINWFYNGYTDEIYETHIVTGDTKEDCFKKVYAFERSGRYDNERHYRITDDALHEEYLNWKQTSVTIDMYYGSATVD